MSDPYSNPTPEDYAKATYEEARLTRNAVIQIRGYVGWILAILALTVALSVWWGIQLASEEDDPAPFGQGQEP